MLIKSVKIAGFGQFEQANWELHPGVQVIYGGNEAGKSTLRQFILSILFGYPTRRHPVERYEPKNSQLYGGSLILTDGVTDYQIDRDAANQVQVQNLTTGVTEPESRLNELLASIDLNLYRQIYTFNQAELHRISQLAPSDLNQQLQQIGAAGSQEWVATQRTIVKDADQLYRPKAHVLPLNIELAKYQQLQQQLNNAADNYQSYQTLTNQQQQNTVAIQQNQDAIKKSQTNLTKLETLVKDWPLFQQYQTASQSKSPSSQIDATTIKQFQTLETQAAHLTLELKNTQQQFNELATVTQGGQIEFYWQHQAEFTQLFQQLAGQQQKLGELQTQQQALQAVQDSLQQTQGDHPELNTIEAGKPEELKQWESVLDNTTEIHQTRRQATSGLSPLIVGGGGLILVGLLLPNFILKLLLVLIGVGVSFWGYQSFNRSNSNKATKIEIWALRWHLTGQSATLTGQQQLLRLWQKRQQQRTELQELQTVIGQLKQQFSEYLQQYSFAAQWLVLDFDQPEQSLTRIEKFRQQVQQMAAQKGTKTANWQYLQKTLSQLRDDLQANQQQQQQIFAKVGVADQDDFQNQLNRQKDVTDLQKAALRLKAQLSDSEMAAFKSYQDYPALITAKQRQQQAIADLQSTGQQLVIDKTDIIHQIAKLTSDGSYDELKQLVANQAAKVSQLTQQWLTAELAAQWIQLALNNASSGRLPRIVMQASSYFSQLTEQRYNKIDFSAKEITIVRRADGQRLTIAELSTGTAEQLYLALRLAMIAVLDLSLPIIIDDGLVNFDQQRKTAAWQLLAQIGQQHQILYFTNETAALTDFPLAQTLKLSNGGYHG